MSVFHNPALQCFVAELGSERVIAQVLVRRVDTGYELRHVADRDRPAEYLRDLNPNDLRALAQFTADGAFRPLKSAPNLQANWVVRARDDAELEAALHRIYPGALADWYAARSARPPLTHYREFTARQTGMYRITSLLDDVHAAQMIRACCHKRFCLKRRLWTVGDLAPDPAQDKSLIPCLEPCALLLEFARTVVRLEQQETARPDTTAGPEPAAPLETEPARPDAPVREADFSAPANPRRLQLLREKLAASPGKLTVGGEEKKPNEPRAQ
jgi:hypothetical protein